MGSDDDPICPISLLTLKELKDTNRQVWTDKTNKDVFYDACSLLTWINMKKTFPHSREPISDVELKNLKELCPQQPLRATDTLTRVDDHEEKPIFEQGLVTYANKNHSIELKCFGNGYIKYLTKDYKIINQISSVLFVKTIDVELVAT